MKKKVTASITDQTVSIYLKIKIIYSDFEINLFQKSM